MQKLTDIGEHFVNELSSRYGLSQDAIVHMLVAVNNGGCSMAQFNCPELGGSGQWMRGGMTMVGDMFNSGLKMTVDNLCNELANVLTNNQIFPVVPAGTPGSNQWWPTDLGQPFSSGAQNNIRYAVFPNRLAVELNGQISIYDTLDHNIGGVSQQQGSNDSLTFSSQWGNIHISSLPLISGQSLPASGNTNFAQENHSVTQSTEAPTTTAEMPNEQFNAANQMIEIITKLSELRDMGVLTEDEFTKKKTELLNKG
ncbi:SHOCT domain-containing protein [Psychromonas sp. 14N.309.X.WAT.B.A12]|uniref:SHOCT domain-containing protein n=1 Tax=unclassified Psychromonas TaxID=2614957 RepID=UPI0025B00642|nr:SHOCT domain-containing protein [Psychromonas sp. 14N.309.X.WAT.B.A12]MDN2664897.1 SHOCT domain-containing protein [Psychromonas sp. 14N.309.X.WAT.B.A12]